MTWNKNHPARSHDFLSRLHDGELSAAERAHFESHRAHCAECRTAAAEYERALSLFRSARSSPPPADLANRVLRKLQSFPSTRRTPFGSLFAIDVRWAGAFAVALLVLLVATPIVLRQEKKAPEAEGPFPVTLQGRDASAPANADRGRVMEEAQRNAPAQPARQVAQKQAAAPPASYASQPPADARQTGPRTERRANDEIAAAKPAAPEPKLEAAAAPAPAASRAQASSTNRVAATGGTVSERSGGEGAREPVIVSADTPTLDRPSRIVIQPLDGQGMAPELLARPEEPDLSDLRGRSFLIVVSGPGRVIDVRETAAKTAPAEDAKRRDSALAKEKDALASDPLKRLRFKAGERARRLLVRVE